MKILKNKISKRQNVWKNCHRVSKCCWWFTSYQLVTELRKATTAKSAFILNWPILGLDDLFTILDSFSSFYVFLLSAPSIFLFHYFLVSIVFFLVNYWNIHKGRPFPSTSLLNHLYTNNKIVVWTIISEIKLLKVLTTVFQVVLS